MTKSLGLENFAMNDSEELTDDKYMFNTSGEVEKDFYIPKNYVGFNSMKLFPSKRIRIVDVDD